VVLLCVGDALVVDDVPEDIRIGDGDVSGADQRNRERNQSR